MSFWPDGEAQNGGARSSNFVVGIGLKKRELSTLTSREGGDGGATWVGPRPGHRDRARARVARLGQTGTETDRTHLF